MDLTKQHEMLLQTALAKCVGWFSPALLWMDVMKQHEMLLQVALAKHLGWFSPAPLLLLVPLLFVLPVFVCTCVCMHASSFSSPLGSHSPLVPSLFASVRGEHLSFCFLLCQRPPRLDGALRGSQAVRKACELKCFKISLRLACV